MNLIQLTKAKKVPFSNFEEKKKSTFCIFATIFFCFCFFASASIYESLKRRAISLATFLNTLEGVSCNHSEGAMYLFPQIRLPPKVVEEARSINKQPDTFYCLQLLENTGKLQKCWCLAQIYLLPISIRIFSMLMLCLAQFYLLPIPQFGYFQLNVLFASFSEFNLI